MAYTLTLTPVEHRSLAWVADRYTSAEVLYDGMELVDGTAGTYANEEWGGTFTIAEHVAWEYADALPNDNGVEGAMLPPCIGGPLGDKLVDLLDSVV